MDKWERVVKGLEACSLAGTKEDCSGYGCPYLIYNDEVSDDCLEHMLDDALALLKAQEPVKPVFDAGDGKTIGQFLCGKCHAKIGLGHPHFCWYCGRPVKWE